jgi:hypothetical protein
MAIIRFVGEPMEVLMLGGRSCLKSFDCEDLRTIASLIRFMSPSLQAVSFKEWHSSLFLVPSRVTQHDKPDAAVN